MSADDQEEERRLGSGGETPETGGQSWLAEGHRFEGDTVLNGFRVSTVTGPSAVWKVTPSRSWRYWRIVGCISSPESSQGSTPTRSDGSSSNRRPWAIGSPSCTG